MQLVNRNASAIEDSVHYKNSTKSMELNMNRRNSIPDYHSENHKNIEKLFK